METIIPPNARILTDLLNAYGCRNAVLSPGSRNAPLIEAFKCREDINSRVVIDERSAAFVALGMSKNDCPVAIVCTSGTAVLNYAPAVAEAYYRHLPLVVVSADRPSEAVERRDSQTIVQPGVLSKIVRYSIDISDDMDASVVELLINRALTDATGPAGGPIHINFHLSLKKWEENQVTAKKIVTYRSGQTARSDFEKLFGCLNASRVLLLAGESPSIDIPEGLSCRGNLAVVGEIGANIHSVQIPITPNGRVPRLNRPELVPDIVLSVGCSMISREIKEMLIKSEAEVINLGYDDEFSDVYGNLVARVCMDPSDFLREWACYPNSEVQSVLGYSAAWVDAVREDTINDNSIAWSDYTAIRKLSEALGESDRYKLFVANGMVARLCQFFQWPRMTECLMNRGVSGIDGCTSTAIGLACAGTEPVVLITGDMGAVYDIGALAIGFIPATFRMVVVDNGGGDIFRRVATTKRLENRDECFVAKPRFPLEGLASAYGFEYLKADSEDTLDSAFAAFIGKSEKPIILHIITTPDQNNQAYKTIYNND